MIAVTDQAKKVLKTVIDRNKDKSWSIFRLAAEENDLGLEAAEKALPTDEVMEHDGVPILVVDKKLSATLKGVTLDFATTSSGPQLVINKEQKKEKKKSEDLDIPMF
ncbi:MAG: hypothetical protein NTV30_09780 [Chloroflexi bacterium]|nr:hypothetical protein [Chloroflexota bacterium]